MTAYEVLQLKVFDDCRDHIKEKALLKMHGSNEYKIFLETDMEDAYDYVNPLNSKYRAKDLLNLLLEEIKDFK